MEWLLFVLLILAYVGIKGSLGDIAIQLYNLNSRPQQPQNPPDLSGIETALKDIAFLLGGQDSIMDRKKRLLQQVKKSLLDRLAHQYIRTGLLEKEARERAEASLISAEEEWQENLNEEVERQLGANFQMISTNGWLKFMEHDENLEKQYKEILKKATELVKSGKLKEIRTAPDNLFYREFPDLSSEAYTWIFARLIKQGLLEEVKEWNKNLEKNTTIAWKVIEK